MLGIVLPGTMLGIVLPGTMLGIPHGIYARVYTPGYTTVHTRPGTRHPACWPHDELAALRRKVAELTVTDDTLTVAYVTITRFTVGRRWRHAAQSARP